MEIPKRTTSSLGQSVFVMLLKHQSYYGLSMDALVTVCSLNTNGIMVGAWNGICALVAVCSWNKTVFTV